MSCHFQLNLKTLTLSFLLLFVICGFRAILLLFRNIAANINHKYPIFFN